MLSTSLFHFDAATKTFSADASDLGDASSFMEQALCFGKYVDAFKLESHVSGHWLTFYRTDTIRNQFDPSEINGWAFSLLLPVDREKYGDLKVMIFND